MPIGYLVTVALAAAATLLALSPPVRRPRMLARMSWLLGTAFNAPFVFCLVLAAATALAIGSGDVDSPGAWAVVGAAVLTMVGLVVVARRGLRTGPVVERALSEGLGTDWTAAIEAEFAFRPRSRLPLAVRPPAEIASAAGFTRLRACGSLGRDTRNGRAAGAPSTANELACFHPRPGGLVDR